jgi:hypothetical protein
VERLLKIYLPRIRTPSPTALLIVNIIRVVIIVIVVLTVLEIWGTPTTPMLIIMGVLILAVALAVRGVVPNFIAGIQLDAAQHVDVGDYVKLETGEEGYVTEMNWNNTRLKALDNHTVVLPNRQLLRSKVINYGKPLKKAAEPFHFYTRSHLTELTGLRARNLREMVDIIKTAPDAAIYYHTHHFLEEHHYLTPEPANDFAVWITDALGDEDLGERIACVNIFEFTSVVALKERFIGIIEERLARNSDAREAMAGREFYFMKSVVFVLPTPYFAHNLREFVEILRKISIDSLYFHVFESRLNMQRGLNDFSIWMRDSLGEEELAEKIAQFDPFSYTLEGLRLALIQLIEKRIK